MKITVFGATGGTGRQIVHQALADGHGVTAVVRRAGVLEPRDGLDVVVADVMRPAEITAYVEGRDAVVSAIGPRTKLSEPSDVCRAAAESIAQAMTAAGGGRLLVLSQATVTTDGDGPFTRLLVKPMLRIMLRNPRADAVRMEKEVVGSGLDWTVLRPPMLTDGRRLGRYRTARGANVRGGLRISRADLAVAVLAVLGDPASARAVIGVAH